MVSLREAFAYEEWANRVVLDHLENLETVPAKAVELFAHLMQARTVWFTRMNGESSAGMKIWPSLELKDCRPLLEGVESQGAGFLDRFEREEVGAEVRYSNQHGFEYRTSSRDILNHLSLHGAYHRGQIALVVRQAGMTPVNTDYITYVRERAGQPWKP